MPAVILAEAVAIFGAIGLLFHFLPGPNLPLISAPLQKTLVHSWQAGEIQVTDLRSGTEFNRILQFPNGKTVVESGYVNHWGEDQIRIIGDRAADP